MTVLTTITVDFNLDPRLAEVDAGVDAISVIDSHDTLTGIGDATEGSQFPGLVQSAGGEDLGGGLSVGLTTTLQNVQYAPTRTASRSTGTATSTDNTGGTFVDSGADFVSDGVARGDWIINFTDQSVTEVLTVTNLTTLQIRVPSDGSNNFFTSADIYKVWEVSEFELAGGNFVAVDESLVNIKPLFTTFGRFITKASASTATGIAVGSGLSGAQATQLIELWRLQGLDISNPMTVTPTTRDAGAGIGQAISGDGVNTTTVTRDP